MNGHAYGQAKIKFQDVHTAYFFSTMKVPKKGTIIGEEMSQKHKHTNDDRKWQDR